MEAAVTTTELVERLRPALALLPIEVHDTPDYAEATGPQFQAMTLAPQAFTALNHLPGLLATIESQQRLIERKDSLLMRFVGTIKGDTLLMLDPDLAALVDEYAALTPSKEG